MPSGSRTSVLSSLTVGLLGVLCWWELGLSLGRLRQGARSGRRNLSARATRVGDVAADTDSSTMTQDPSTVPLDTSVGSRPRILLLDGHSLAYRAFFALPVENFSTTTGQHTNAVYGFTSMLINMLRDEQPTHICVAFDVSRKTFRAEQYADYKAGRSKSPDE